MTLFFLTYLTFTMWQWTFSPSNKFHRRVFSESLSTEAGWCGSPRWVLVFGGPAKKRQPFGGATDSDLGPHIFCCSVKKWLLAFFFFWTCVFLFCSKHHNRCSFLLPGEFFRWIPWSNLRRSLSLKDVPKIVGRFIWRTFLNCSKNINEKQFLWRTSKPECIKKELYEAKATRNEANSSTAGLWVWFRLRAAIRVREVLFWKAPKSERQRSSSRNLWRSLYTKRQLLRSIWVELWASLCCSELWNLQLNFVLVLFLPRIGWCDFEYLF